MKNFPNAVRLSSMVLAAALLTPALSMAQNVATVNGKPVPKARVDALLAQASQQAMSQGQELPPDFEQQVRDEVVLREIFVQEAERRGLPASREYRQAMETARQSILVRELYRDFEAKNKTTDAEVQAEYDKVKAQTSGAKEYHTRHILVEKEDEAKALIAKIKAGSSFEEVAKKSSKDGSAANGGDLGWTSPEGLVPEFSKVMTELPKGGMTDTPVETQFGWHIIKLEDVREAPFPPLDQVKPQIQQRLAQLKVAAFREKLKREAKTDYKFLD